MLTIWAKGHPGAAAPRKGGVESVCERRMKESEEAGSLPSSCLSQKGEYLPLPRGHPLSSLPKTFANLVLCTLGSGVLGLPYTFSRVGWVIGVLLLIVSAAVAYHGMMLQVYSKHRLCRSQHSIHSFIAGYGDLVYHVFGSRGRLAVDLLLTLSCVASTISYVTFISQNAASIASGLQGTHLSSAADVLEAKFSQAGISGDHAILPNLKVDAPKWLDVASRAQENYTTLQFNNGNLLEPSSQNQVSRKEMRMVGWTSENLSFSASSSLEGSLGGISWLSSSTYTWLVFPLQVALAAIPSLTLLAPVSAVGDLLSFAALAAVMVYDVMKIAKTASFQNMRAFGNMLNVPSAFGVGVYTFQSSGMVIPVEAAMEKPSKLGSVLGLAFLLCGTLFALFAILGYGAYNENTQQVITLNLPSGMETIAIKVAICSSLFLAFPLVLNPMFELVERRFTRRKASLGLRALVVFVICLLATTVKQFTVLLSLAGSSISCLLGFILPAAVHLKVIKEDVDNPPSFLLYAADCALIVFGVSLGAFGTTVSFLELIGS